jgi:hypothetical protein
MNRCKCPACQSDLLIEDPHNYCQRHWEEIQNDYQDQWADDTLTERELEEVYGYHCI